jgi:hypothetical protein
MYDRGVSLTCPHASGPEASGSRSEALLLETLRGLRVHALTASPRQLAEDLTLGRLLYARLRTPALCMQAEGFLEAIEAMLRFRSCPAALHP